MKRTVLTLLFFLYHLLLLTQVCKASDTLVVDLDLDKNADSVFYDRQSSLIICKLSTQGFLAIQSDTIKNTDPMSHISISIKGFRFTNDWMREGYHCEFAYNKELKKIQLVGIDRYAFGPANNDGSGESALNLLTGDYRGKWHYYDERREQLVKMPVLKKKIVLPATYLQNFSDGIFYEYENICRSYYEDIKAGLVTDSKTQTFSKSFTDINGKNLLEIRILNPCILDTPPWDADQCTITATLTNTKTVSKLFYDHPDAQMSLIYLVEKEIAVRKIDGITAVFIPFYYCGATESFDRKVSYFIFYKGRKYDLHLNYYCEDEKKCKVVQGSNTLFKSFPIALKSYFSKYLAQKHRLRSSFHQE